MSRRYRQIMRKERRQIDHALHIISKRFVERCAAKGVGRVVFGDLTGIRESIDYGTHANQRLRAWAFAKLVRYARYKAERLGIAVETVEESYTSRTCSACGHRKTSAVGGRRFVCPNCGVGSHRDLNGARNIYRRARMTRAFARQSRPCEGKGLPTARDEGREIPNDSGSCSLKGGGVQTSANHSLSFRTNVRNLSVPPLFPRQARDKLRDSFARQARDRRFPRQARDKPA